MVWEEIAAKIDITIVAVIEAIIEVVLVAAVVEALVILETGAETTRDVEIARDMIVIVAFIMKVATIEAMLVKKDPAHRNESRLYDTKPFQSLRNPPIPP